MFLGCFSHEFSGIFGARQCLARVKRRPLPDLLKKPIAGSAATRDGSTPSEAALRTLRARRAAACGTGSPARTGAGECAQRISEGEWRETTLAMRASPRRPVTSFSIAAPSAIAALAAGALAVSADMGRPVERAAAATAALRRSASVRSGTAVAAYGALDIPPMSMMSAPSASMRAAAAEIALGVARTEEARNDSGLALIMPTSLGGPGPPRRTPPRTVTMV